MDHLISRFVADIHLREALKAYVYNFLEREVVEKAFQGDDVRFAKETKLIIDKIFIELETNYQEFNRQNVSIKKESSK